MPVRWVSVLSVGTIIRVYLLVPTIRESSYQKYVPVCPMSGFPSFSFFCKCCDGQDFYSDCVCFFFQVIPEGVAAKTMRLRIGDRILKVNGRDVSKASHQEAVQALLEPTAELILTVQHDPPPKGLQEMTIHRFEGEKLGMNIKGGLRGHPGNPLDKHDEGVFISKINHAGAAKRDGRLKVNSTLSVSFISFTLNGFVL